MEEDYSGLMAPPATPGPSQLSPFDYNQVSGLTPTACPGVSSSHPNSNPEDAGFDQLPTHLDMFNQRRMAHRPSMVGAISAQTTNCTYFSILESKLLYTNQGTL